MELSDLVLLQYRPDINSVEVVSLGEAQRKNPNLKIDLKKRTWSYEKIKDFPIGKRRNFTIPYLNGPLGVYDKTNINHLDLMINDAIICKEEYENRELDMDTSLDMDDE